MTDIADRLRAWADNLANPQWPPAKMAREAANEIERLNTERKRDLAEIARLLAKIKKADALTTGKCDG